MTFRWASRVGCIFTMTLSFACGGDDERNSGPGVLGGTGEVAPAPCSIVDDVLTLPSDGTCVLSADQQARYGYRGADPQCRGGRIDMGGIIAGRLTLGELTIVCEAAAPTGGVTPDTAPLPIGSEAMGDIALDANDGAGDEATGDNGIGTGGTGSDELGPDDPAGSTGLGLTSGQWFQLEDDFSAGCDLVNGADFEAIIPSGGGRLIVVSQLNADVSDFELPGLVLDADFNLLSDQSQEPVARIRYKQDDDGTRRPWLIRPDGLAYGLDGGDDGNFPRAYARVECQSCGLVDGADAQACQAAISQRIPSEGISPARDLLARAGVIADANSMQLLEWRDFDSQLGETCGLMHGTDFRLLVQGGALNTVPDELGEDVETVGVGFSLLPVDFNDPTLGGTWHLFDSEGSLKGDVVFANDSAGELRVWLLGNDGNVLTRSFVTSGNTPRDLPPVACDPCLFFAESNAQCVPLDAQSADGR
jgi:hypothetical protein